MTDKVFQKLTQLAEILTARKIDPTLFAPAHFQDFNGEKESRYLVWKVEDVDYESAFDVSLSEQEKERAFYFSIHTDRLVAVNFVCHIDSCEEHDYLYTENVSCDNDCYDFAEKIGFKSMRYDCTEREEFLKIIDEMIRFHKQFI